MIVALAVVSAKAINVQVILGGVTLYVPQGAVDAYRPASVWKECKEIVEIDVVAKYLDKIREKGRTLLVIDHTDGIEDYFTRWIQIENKKDVLYGTILK